MAKTTILTATLLFGAGALAVFEELSFSSEALEWKCPEFGFECIPPRVCAYEKTLDKHYCCDPGSDDAICWSGSSECGPEQTPTTGQIGCSSGENAYCCLQTREECTQTFNQINICWARAENPVAKVDEQLLNDTFSSLSSASPEATVFVFDVSEILSTSTSAPTSDATADVISSTPNPTGDVISSQAETASATSTPVLTTSIGATDDSSASVSGGAIGGIVVGVVGGLAAVGIGIFFLLRRRKNKRVTDGNTPEMDANPYLSGGSPPRYTGVPQTPPPQEKYAHHGAPQPQSNHAPVELPVDRYAVEMPGSKPEQTRGSPQVI